MRKLLPLLFSIALLISSGSQAATPADTLIVAISLAGIISFNPAESF